MSTIKTITSTSLINGCVPSNFEASSGKQNLMASLNSWFVDVINGGQTTDAPLLNTNDFFWAFDYPLAPLNMPAIGISEVGLFNLGERAFDDNLIGFKDDGTPIRAVRNQTLIEINCWAKDSDDFGGATKKVRELRDRLIYALEFTGVRNADDTAFIIPPIYLKDFTQPNNPIIGLVFLDPAGNSINEKFLIDPAINQLKKYKLLIRFLYDEYIDPL